MRATLLFASAFFSAAAHAVGLGQIQVQSAIGEPLRARIPLLTGDSGESIGSCFNAKLMSMDGALIANLPLRLMQSGQSATLLLASPKSINEPAFTLLVEVGCPATMSRDYQILLDLPVVSEVDTRRATAQARTQDFDAPIPLPSSTGRVGSVIDEAAGTTARSSGQQLPSATQTARTAPAKQDVVKTAKPKTIKRKPAGNVLKLSNRDVTDAELFGTPRPPAPAASPKPAVPANVQKSDQTPVAAPAPVETAQDKLTGDALMQATELKLLTMQSRILELELEAAKLKQAAANSAAALSSANAPSNKMDQSNGWLAGLTVLLFASLGAIAWLTLRMNELKANRSVSDWEDSVSASGDEVDHKVDGQTAVAASEPATATPRKPDESGRTPAGQALTMPTAGAVTDEPEDDAAYRRRIHALASDVDHDNDGVLLNPVRTEMPKVEEVSDVIQQAEFWMSLHDVPRAVELLEQYGNDASPNSPIPWLYLFDLYRELGDREKYESLVERFRHEFNGKIPQWDEDPASQHSRGLEDLPQLSAKISSLWQSDNIVPFLENLLIDDREGERMGFDLPIYKDIILLTSIAYATQESGSLRKPAFQLPIGSMIS